MSSTYLKVELSMLPPDFKLNTPISSRENMIRVFERKKPMFVPNTSMTKV